MKHFWLCAFILPASTMAWAQENPQLELNTGHSGGVNGLLLTRSGDVVWSAGRDKTIRRWSPDLSSETGRLQGAWHETTAWALSADGSTLAIAYGAGNIALHATADLKKAPQRVTWSDSPQAGVAVRGLAFGTDGKLLTALVTPASSGGAPVTNQILSWKLPEGAVAGKFEVKGPRIKYLTLTERGTIMTAGEEGDLTEYTLSGTQEDKARLSQNGVLSPRPAALSPRGDFVLGDNFTLYDTNHASLKGKFGTSQLRPGRLEGGFFSEDNKLVVGYTDILRGWAGNGGKELYSFFYREDPVESLALSADGTVLATGHSSSAIHLREAQGGKMKAQILGGPAPWDSLRWVQDEIVLERWGLLSRWSGKTGQPVANWTEPRGTVTAVAVSRDGSLMATAIYCVAPPPPVVEGENPAPAPNPQPEPAPEEEAGNEAQARVLEQPKNFAELRVTDTRTNQLLWSKVDTVDGWVINRLVFSEDNSTVLSGATKWDKNSSGESIFTGIEAHQAQTGEKDELYFLQGGKINGVQSLAVSTDGHKVFGQDASSIYAWQLPLGTQILKVSLPGLRDGKASMSRDGRYLAAITTEGWNLWDLSNGKTTSPVRQVKDLAAATTIAFGADNDLVVGDRQGNLHLYRGQALTQDGPAELVRGDGFALENLKSSPSGKMLAGTGTDGRLRVWDMAGRLRATLVQLAESEGKPGWIAFTPAGKFAASPGAEKLLNWRVQGKLVPGATHADAMRAPGEVSRALTP